MLKGKNVLSVIEGLGRYERQDCNIVEGMFSGGRPTPEVRFVYPGNFIYEGSLADRIQDIYTS